MIKVLVPSMPTADEILPFLREIDERRVYVNGGPLVRRLETSLQEIVGNPCRVVANGTVSLELALRALNLPRGCQVLVPAVTYVASAQAIVNAGLRPALCDVDPVTWQLTPQIAAAALPYTPRVCAVMPVATFGAAVPVEPWERFAQESGLPVLIDAAGAIYGQKASTRPEIIVSYSLHATKALGAGEGGVVACADGDLLARVEELANFGPGGTNAKMSEYHAAVGLASIKKDPIHTPWRSGLFNFYWYNGGLQRLVTPFRIDHSLAVLLPVLIPERARNGNFSPAINAQITLACAGIEAKQWYRPFLNERAEFRGCERMGDLPVTTMLRDHCLGLPWHEFLSEADVARVCEVLGGML